jgi:L-ascorbate metabolism protein UlaG (beta-lactamase superfamily)
LENTISIQYLGCSAFVLEDSDTHTRLGVDLWTPGAFKYAEDIPPDHQLHDGSLLTSLLVSHDHADHSYLPAGLPGKYAFLDDLIEDHAQLAEIGPFSISSFSTFHFATKSKNPKMCAAFVIRFAGFTLLDLADSFGTMARVQRLSALKEKIGDINILMMPVGSPFLRPVAMEILQQTVDILDPGVVIPIHYWTIEQKANFCTAFSQNKWQVVSTQQNRVLVNFEAGEQAKQVWCISPGIYAPTF